MRDWRGLIVSFVVITNITIIICSKCDPVIFLVLKVIEKTCAFEKLSRFVDGGKRGKKIVKFDYSQLIEGP